jgi:hypothetical protein
MAQATKSRKRAGASKTKNATRKQNHSSKRAVLSVSDIRNRFKEMDETVRVAVKNGLSTPASLGKHVSRNWAKLFKKPLSSKAAASLAQHYLNLHGKKKGGSLSGAPLDYIMRPGLPAVATYATFPTEVGADPQAVKDMDVYYNNALGRSCGLEDTTAKPWAGIGTNVVPLPASGPLAAPPAKGGRRKVGGTCRKSMCVGGGLVPQYSSNQRIIKGGKRSTKRSTKRNNRKTGGDFMTALSARQYIGVNPAGLSQRGSESWMGLPTNPHDVADPSTKGWHYAQAPTVSMPYLPPTPRGDMTLASHPRITGVSAVP